MPSPSNRREKWERRISRIFKLGGVFSTWTCFKEFGEYLIFSDHLTKIRNIETVQVSDLRSILTEDGEDKLAVVRGIIKVKPFMELNWQPPQGLVNRMIALKSDLSGGKSDYCVASQAVSRVTDPQFFWGKIPFFSTQYRAIPFAITDPNGAAGCVVVNIFHHAKAIHPVPFTTIFSCLNEDEEKLGLIEEKILPLGKEITAIGKLCFRRGSYPIIESCKDLPYFLSDMTKEEMIQDLDSSKHSKLCSVLVMATVSVFLLGYAFRGRWRKSIDDERKHDDNGCIDPPLRTCVCGRSLI